MGLLSDPEYGSMRWVGVLRKAHTPTCLICFFGAIIWFLLLGSQEFNNETYFSENALLPGLVTNEFNAEPAAKQYQNEYINELEEKYSDVSDMPVPWLVAKMTQLHLEVYTHNFTLNYPLGQGQVYKGTNVYGILRSPRTASLEALVISVPFRPLNSFQKGTTASVALMLAFAKFARLQKYWAKDFIFLVTEHEHLGMQAWLEAYHGLKSDTETFYSALGTFWKLGSPTLDLNQLGPGFTWNDELRKCLDPGELKGRSGSIQAAINLEFHTQKIKYVEVKVEGLNGQLPNLDLVNLVHKLCDKFMVHHSYESSYSWMKSKSMVEQWKTGIKTMWGMILTQVSGVPNGNHGLFHRFGIEAITLEGRDARDVAGSAPRAAALPASSFYRLGILLESTMRSLNNLLERFHQSYFFYVLAGTDRFVSIGQYMPCLCLLCVALLVRALYLWVSLQQTGTLSDVKENTEADKSKEEDKKKEGDKQSNEKADEQKQDGEKNQDGEQTQDVGQEKDGGQKQDAKQKAKKAVKKNTKVLGAQKTKEFPNIDDMNVVNIGTNYVFVHLIGYTVMNLPPVFSWIGATYYTQPSEVSIFYGLVITCLLLTVLTPIVQRFLRKGPMTYEEVALTNILVLIELATVCLSIGMFNFSLGLIVAMVYAPMALVIKVVRRDAGRMSTVLLQLKRIFCLLAHPLAGLTLTMIVFGRLMFPDESILSSLERGRDATMNAIMFAIVDSLLYGNWLFNVTATILLPMWLVFWQILCVKVDTK